MRGGFSALPAALEARRAAGLYRSRAVLDSAQGSRVRIDGKDLLAFCSNDYLGLANHPALKAAMREAIEEWGVGGGASALVAGHFAIQQQAEEALAEFVGCEAALLFGSGYAANLGVVSSLVGRGDAIFADKLNHASLVDGALLAKATVQRYAHRNLAVLERQLSQCDASATPIKLIVTDVVPLPLLPFNHANVANPGKAGLFLVLIFSQFRDPGAT